MFPFLKSKSIQQGPEIRSRKPVSKACFSCANRNRGAFFLKKFQVKNNVCLFVLIRVTTNYQVVAIFKISLVCHLTGMVVIGGDLDFHDFCICLHMKVWKVGESD